MLKYKNTELYHLTVQYAIPGVYREEVYIEEGYCEDCFNKIPL